MLVHNECVARKGKLRADVRAGGDPNHATPHAHIWDGTDEIASIDENGKILAGKLHKKAQKFVKDYLDDISNGIKELYNKL